MTLIIADLNRVAHRILRNSTPNAYYDGSLRSVDVAMS